jgi:hypothetical protein
LLHRAKLDYETRMMVLTAVNFDMKDTLFQQMKKALIKFKGSSTHTPGSSANT